MNFTNLAYPEDFYKFDFYKVCGIVASLLNIFAVTPLVFFIIWYDTNIILPKNISLTGVNTSSVFWTQGLSVYSN
jgi:hypothetical protein